MKLIRSDHRRVHEDHLIPLINIIFLMLIFFMVMGRLTSTEVLAIEPPVSGQGETAEAQEHVLLIGRDGQIALGDEVIAQEALGERVEALLAATSDSTVSPSSILTLKADASVRAGQLRQVLDLLRAAGVPRVSLLTAKVPKASLATENGR